MNHLEGLLEPHLVNLGFILKDEENRKIQNMKKIVEGFMSWERFDHKNALEH